MERGGWIYIMTNKNKSTLYVGVTSDLFARILDHQSHNYPDSFTARYNLVHCIFYEAYPTITEAITREKEIKKWRRKKKEELINQFNSSWSDLWDEIKDW